MTPAESAAYDAADKRVMVFFDRNGVPNFTLVHIIDVGQTVDFLARFPVVSGEWRAVPAVDASHIDFTLPWGEPRA
jgi:hypothetical protein